MSYAHHIGWPAEALRLMAKAERLRKVMREAVEAKITDTPEIVSMRKELTEAQARVIRIREDLYALETQASQVQRKDLTHIQRDIEAIMSKVKKLKDGVPKRVLNFIENITCGVDYGAPFQIVWWNKRFVILRLPGRKCWNGRGCPPVYVPSETKMFDMLKVNRRATGIGPRGDSCVVNRHEGKLSAALLKEWKQAALFATA